MTISKRLAKFMDIMNKHGVNSDKANGYLMYHSDKKKFHRLARMSQRLKRALEVR